MKQQSDPLLQQKKVSNQLLVSEARECAYMQKLFVNVIMRMWCALTQACDIISISNRDDRRQLRTIRCFEKSYSSFVRERFCSAGIRVIIMRLAIAMGNVAMTTTDPLENPMCMIRLDDRTRAHDWTLNNPEPCWVEGIFLKIDIYWNDLVVCIYLPLPFK